MDFREFFEEHKNAFLMSSLAFNILLIILCVYFYNAYKNKECPECICNENKSVAMKSANECQASNNSNIKSEDDKFYIEVKGAVLKPGVYEVDNEIMIDDVINLAGGLSKDAYTNNINLSHKVSSEEVIYVYTDEEYAYLHEDIFGPTIDTKCPTSSYDISDCTLSAKSEIVTEEEYNKDTWENEDTLDVSESDTSTTSNDKCGVQVQNTETSTKQEVEVKGKINLNTASKEELMTLDYIGEAKANAIIAYRQEQGSFKSIEEVKNVKGIGDILYSKIKDHITV